MTTDSPAAPSRGSVWRAVGWLLVAIAVPLAVFVASHNTAAYFVLERGHEPTLLISSMAVFSGLFVITVVGAFASLGVRFRCSRGVERRPMTWLVLAAALVPPTILRYGCTTSTASSAAPSPTSFSAPCSPASTWWGSSSSAGSCGP